MTSPLDDITEALGGIPLGAVGPVMNMALAIKKMIDAGDDKAKQLKALMDHADWTVDEIQRRRFETEP